jgi:UDP-N-acetylglucosamine acyltransferase
MITNGIPQAVVSPNFVGLKRRGFSEETLLGLKEAHRLLWRSGLPKPEAITLTEQRYPSNPDIKYLLDFMRSIDRGRNGRSREAPKADGAPAEEGDAKPEAAE